MAGNPEEQKIERQRAMMALNRMAAYAEGESARIGNRFLSYLFALARLQSESELAETGHPPAEDNRRNRR